MALLFAASAPVCAATAQDNIPQPDIVINGSVLQTLNPAAGRERSLAPIKLIPPPDVPVAQDSEPAPDLTANAPFVAQAPETQALPKKGRHIAARNVPVPPAKPEQNQPKPKTTLATIVPDSTPATLPPPTQKIASKAPAPPMAVPSLTPGEVSKATEQTAAPVKTASAIKPAPKPAPAPHDLYAPPEPLKEVAGLKAPVARPVFFPIKVTRKTNGDINPGAKPTPDAPAIPGTATQKAITKAMAMPAPAPVKAALPVQESTPQEPQQKPVATANAAPFAPVPRARPSITMASQAFVQHARRIYEDTYTVIHRDGAPMPAVAPSRVAEENLPASRLSVADIASDPLASKLVAMSPDQVAAALNKITPAAGNEAGRMVAGDLEQETRHPRIVRVMGNWTPRDREPGPQKTTAPDAITITHATPVKDHYTLVFKPGQASLPAPAQGEMDNGILAALQAEPSVRARIVAWAGAKDGKDSTARRIALSRALAVRSYLIDKGIDATRLDVRAMGLEELPQGAAADQVQMTLLQAKKS